MAIYIKLTEEFYRSFFTHYVHGRSPSMTDPKGVFESFLKEYPQHIITDIPQPTETKERDELLMVAAIYHSHGGKTVKDCIHMADTFIRNFNAACETKEDNK